MNNDWLTNGIFGGDAIRGCFKRLLQLHSLYARRLYMPLSFE